MTYPTQKGEREEALLPCPFCGGDAEIVHIEEGENAGGSCVCCKRCNASSNVEFEFKENFISNWNRRSSSKAEGEMREALDDMKHALEKLNGAVDAMWNDPAGRTVSARHQADITHAQQVAKKTLDDSPKEGG